MEDYRTPHSDGIEERDKPDALTLAYYENEEEVYRSLIDATDLYRSRKVSLHDSKGRLVERGGGTLPEVIGQLPLPTLVTTQTLEDRNNRLAPSSGRGAPDE